MLLLYDVVVKALGDGDGRVRHKEDNWKGGGESDTRLRRWEIDRECVPKGLR